jgi:hypothetical protein
LVAYATNNADTDIPIRTSAMTCAANAARRQGQIRPRGTKSIAPSNTMFGGQKGAKILSERVPTKNAASAPSQYAAKIITAVCVVPLALAIAGARMANSDQFTVAPFGAIALDATVLFYRRQNEVDCAACRNTEIACRE